MDIAEIVTVVTPTVIGREEKLERCRASVRNQIYPYVQHKFFLDKDYRGPAYARNQIIREVDTEWVSFLDDDDVMLSDHLSTHMNYAAEADVIFSWGNVIHPDGGIALFDSSYNPERILAGHNTIPVTATVRTDLLKSVNGFSETERFEDWALWKALIQHQARFKCIEEVTWQYCVDHGNRNSEE